MDRPFLLSFETAAPVVSRLVHCHRVERAHRQLNAVTVTGGAKGGLDASASGSAIVTGDTCTASDNTRL